MSSFDSLFRQLAEVQLRRDIGELAESEVISAVALALEQTGGLTCTVRMTSGATGQSPGAGMAADTAPRMSRELPLRSLDDTEIGVLTLLDSPESDTQGDMRLALVVSRILGREDEVTKAWKGLHQVNNSLATVLANLELADAILSDHPGGRPNDAQRPTLSQAVRQALEATVDLVQAVQKNRARRRTLLR